MDCLHAFERLSANLDGELTAQEAVEVRHHLAHCDGCARKQRLLQQTRTALRAVTLDGAAAGFDAAVARRLRGRLAPWRWLSMAGVAAAAAVVVFVLQRPERAAPVVPEAAPALTVDVQPGWNDGLVPVAAECGVAGATSCVVEVLCRGDECREPDRAASVGAVSLQ